AGDAAEQFQQPPVAWPVNPAGPRDDDLDAGSRGRLARNPLPFDLRDLVDVAGAERSVFVRRGMLDVAMNANRAAVHDPAHAGCRGGLNQLPDRRCVDLMVNAL